MKTKITIPNPDFDETDNASIEELTIEVKFLYDEGYPATMIDPADGPYVEILNDEARKLISRLDDHEWNIAMDKLIEAWKDDAKWP